MAVINSTEKMAKEIITTTYLLNIFLIGLKSLINNMTRCFEYNATIFFSLVFLLVESFAVVSFSENPNLKDVFHFSLVYSKITS